MPKLDSPLQLSPVFKARIWGRDDLAPLFVGPRIPPQPEGSRQGRPASPPPERDLIGEVWITGDEARFLNGLVAGLTLGEASAKFGTELLGKAWKDDRFPILAKYVFTSDWLSVQVHPDDAQAQVYDPGNRGKWEMWHVVDAGRRAKILLGVKRGLSKETLQAACQKGSSRSLLNGFRPIEGEAILVPPGTVHALGPGLVLFEVQENSDLTYRLDDFGRVGLDGRPRPLHLEKGLAVTRMELPMYRNLPRVKFREPFGWRRHILACRFFALEELTLQKPGTFEGSLQRVEILSVLEGEGRVEIPAGWLGYRRADTWLIPPATGKYRLVPRQRTRLLKCYVPDLDKDFLRPLAQRGVRAFSIHKLVFD